LKEDDLSKEQWAEIYRREKMLESGEMKWMNEEEFNDLLNKKKNVIQ